jgi:ABC-2 type transport system ATP-binding protein
LLSEVEKIATHFGVINKGIIQFQGSKETLQKLRSDTSKLELEIDNSEKAMTILKEKFDTVSQGGSVLHVKGVDRTQVPEITRKLIDAEVGIYSIGFKQDNLEETFFNLVS